ncbi:hypothetical protein FOQG_19369 [Fusarium oxysporum f. sp. raphani 54005]|uniref:RING-type domain-containing protein n=1 Tax=Fusarium oxysporum f. sp. raphani 54005 TaxID=1089458 RepID=X0BZA1_FUSOX|nr:hypothetical protein FOQG_19369 [Fusarium oxysporum f. sp. raphani 54005]KAH7199150.1 hypothetical protein BKA60DRAFT_686066 [Fusarium oxysporum]
MCIPPHDTAPALVRRKLQCLSCYQGFTHFEGDYECSNCGYEGFAVIYCFSASLPSRRENPDTKELTMLDVAKLELQGRISSSMIKPDVNMTSQLLSYISVIRLRLADESIASFTIQLRPKPESQGPTNETILENNPDAILGRYLKATFHVLRLRDYAPISVGFDGGKRSSDKVTIPSWNEDWITTTAADICRALMSEYDSMLHEIGQELSRMSGEGECAKCMKFGKLVTLLCNHTLCSGCYQSLALEPAKCPYCLREIIAWNFSLETGHHFC